MALETPYRRRETVIAERPVAPSVSEPTAETPAVRDVMTPAPTCVAPEASVLQLVRMFHAKRFRHLPVTAEGGKLVGIVSDRDVVRCFGPTDYPDEKLLAGIRAETIMSQDVITIAPDASVVDVVDVLLRHGVSSLPVVDGERLVGIVTTSDLLRLLRRSYTE